MNNFLFHYRAFVTEVYDGDTITVDIDLGLKTWVKKEKLRLNRINAPEIKGRDRPNGIKSRDFLRSIVLNQEIILRTVKDKKGKFGRYLGEIFIIDPNGNEININDLLVAEKFAKYQSY